MKLLTAIIANADLALQRNDLSEEARQELEQEKDAGGGSEPGIHVHI